MKKQYLLILALLLAFSCQQNSIKKNPDGVVITLDKKTAGGAAKIMIQVISDNIIHIAVSPQDEFSGDTSLAVLRNINLPSEWQYREEGDSLIVGTATLNVAVSKKTGEVVFMDKEGRVKLKELPGGGKSFKPVVIDDEQLWSISQVFEAQGDEAFYGLGQHQNGQMNYKGQDVELAQHNIAVAVPMLYSRKNYGLLWDNYSITRFGDPREYRELSSLQLFDKNGVPGGLTATFLNPDGRSFTRTDSAIRYRYIDTYDSMPVEFSTDEGKVTWEGSFTSETGGTHKFMLYASNYYKLWVDDKLIIDRWRQVWNPWLDRFTVDIEPGIKHTLKVEWIPGGKNYMSLQHLDPYGEEKQNRLSLYSEAGKQIDYYFINGSSADDVISGYRQLTGKAPIMPSWAMGLWQCRERYRTQEELLGIVKEFRKRNIPLDNIVQDWFYWPENQWGSHDFDKARYPDPAGMVRTLHQDLHAHIMISVWPKFYSGTDHFNQMQERGYLYRRNLQKQVKDWVGYPSTFYDAFNPGARQLFWKQMHDKLYVYDFDAWWMDATEPDMESNNSPAERKLLMNPTFLGSGTEYYNAYSLLNCLAVYQGQRAVDPDRRVFMLTRSAFTGQQRYAAATWSGDVASRWADLRDQIPAGINFSISGIPFWTTDIGGFAVEKRYEDASGEDLAEWRELMTRWFQFGAFCPLFRVHGQYPHREMYNVAPPDHPAYRSMLYYDRLRYRLMPYIYSLDGMVWLKDYTIMRALVMDFRNDLMARNIYDQYLFGPALMVCPVHEYKARVRDVYLPSGYGWYDLYTGKYFEGGQMLKAEAPLEKIPVFVKEGSIIPLGPELRYTGEKPADPVKLFIYTGKDASFTLYEDEGVNYNYEKGMFSVIEITYNESGKELTIGARKGEYPGMLVNRIFEIIPVSQREPVPVDFARPGKFRIEYNGQSSNIKL